MIGALLALCASVCWGLGDVIAGLAGRKTSPWTVSFVSQAASLPLGIAFLAALGHDWPSLRVVAPSLAAGLGVGLGMGAYFAALAMGTMSLVAPIGASGTVVPIIVGLIRGEQPSTIQTIGVIAAFIGVALAVIDRKPEAGVVGTIEVGAPVDMTIDGFVEPVMPPGRAPEPLQRPRLAAALAVVSAICFGGSLVGYAVTAVDDPLVPAVAARVASVPVLVVLVAVFRARALRAAGRVAAAGGPAPAPAPGSLPGYRLSWPMVPRVVLAGGLHLAAATFFALATTRGLLSLVSVLSSLSAVVTMTLAYFVVRERLEPQQLVGVVLALAGVLAIAGG